MTNFTVNTIVDQKDGESYIQLVSDNGIFAKLSMADAKLLAIDILIETSYAYVKPKDGPVDQADGGGPTCL